MDFSSLDQQEPEIKNPDEFQGIQIQVYFVVHSGDALN
jgi:hypothetical protein